IACVGLVGHRVLLLLGQAVFRRRDAIAVGFVEFRHDSSFLVWRRSACGPGWPFGAVAMVPESSSQPRDHCAPAAQSDVTIGTRDGRCAHPTDRPESGNGSSMTIDNGGSRPEDRLPRGSF